MNINDRKSQEELHSKVDTVVNDMTWVKKILSNHLQHHARLEIGLVVAVVASLLGLVITLAIRLR